MATDTFEGRNIQETTAVSTLQWQPYPWLGLVLGIGVLGQLYMQASQGDAAYLFERFWLGMFVFYIPAFWRLLTPNVSRTERITLLVFAAVFSYLPKLFRCPYYFCYSDELTWWRGVQNLIQSGQPILENPLGLVQGAFPGLPLLTVIFQKISGLSTFHAGLALMGVLRVVTLVTIFLLGESFFKSSRVGVAAALVYMMNPNFMFFSSQFSYESLSVPVLLLTLLILQHLLQPVQRTARWSWVAMLLLNISALVITHHLATYMLIVMFILIAIMAKILSGPNRETAQRLLVGVTFYTIVFALAWLRITGVDIVEYLGDPISRGIEQMVFLVIRKPFGQISLPWYEVISGYLSAILIALIAAYGAYLLWQKKIELQPLIAGLLAFGSLYILIAPLVLTPWGAEGGRRSWVYSYIGLGLLAGFALAWLASHEFPGNRRNGVRWGHASATFALVLLLLGSVAASTSISARFPGTYLQNADARSFTPEIITAAQWMLDQAGPNQRVLGDRTTERIFGSYGLQQPAMHGGPHPWNVYLPTSWTNEAIGWLEDAEAPFVVVDKRMAELPPQMDYRFQRNEPPNDYTHQPVPVESVKKFSDLPRLDRIYDSGNIRIYYQNDTQLNPFSNQVTGSSLSENLSPVVHGSRGGSNPAWTMLSIFVRAIFLVACLVLFGYFIGLMMFPNWLQIEVITRLMLSISFSLSATILSAFLLSTIFSVGNAALLVAVFYGASLLLLLNRIFANGSKRKLGGNLRISREVFNRAVQSEEAWISTTGLTAILLILLATWMIRPIHSPRTDLALDFSEGLPGVQITNAESEAKTYRLAFRLESAEEPLSQEIFLEKDQTIAIPIQPSSSPFSGDKLTIDLYLDGAATPYRSLYLSNKGWNNFGTSQTP